MLQIKLLQGKDMETLTDKVNEFLASLSSEDDSGSDDAVVGLCQECGGRRRFSAKACERFKDVRR